MPDDMPEMLEKANKRVRRTAGTVKIYDSMF